MSNDSTELTFVRCPSCRSLVPAISTKCRMCGAALEATGSSDGGEEVRRNGGRVRQRTSSETRGELSNAVKALREEHAGAGQSTMAAAPAEATPPPAPVNQQPISSHSAVEDDPLADYIEELEDSGDSAAYKDPFGDPPVEESHKVDSSEPIDDIEELDDVDQILDQDPAPAPTSSPVSSNGHGAEAEDDDGFYNPFLKKLDSFEKAAEKIAAAPVVEAVAPVAQAPEPKKIDPVNEIVDPRVAREVAASKKEAKEPKEVKSKEPKEDMNKVDNSKGKGAQPAKATPNKLVGWLVSFKDPSGAAIELREGKVFVTADPLKGESIILEDGSISTPHALLQISVANGLVVQDLMSEHGVYVKRGESSEYIREEDVATVENGDSIRFGSVEFLVALVPYSSK